MHVHPLIHSELARQRQLDLQRACQRQHRVSDREEASTDTKSGELAALVRRALAQLRRETSVISARAETRADGP